jgi:hypothetical protein
VYDVAQKNGNPQSPACTSSLNFNMIKLVKRYNFNPCIDLYTIQSSAAACLTHQTLHHIASYIALKNNSDMNSSVKASYGAWGGGETTKL